MKLKFDQFSLFQKNDVIFHNQKIYQKINDFDLISIDRDKAKIKNKNKDKNFLSLKRKSAFVFENNEENIECLIYGNQLFLKIKETENLNNFQSNFEKLLPFSYEKSHRLINSENFLGLQRLAHYKQKIDCIIIAPPYNTQNSNMKYNDVMGNKNWEVFMRNRLKEAYDLLSEDGVIFIHINDKEYARLRLLMDELFQEQNFIENFIWKKNSIKNNSKTTSNNHEYILCFAKNKSNIEKLNYFRVPKEGLKELNDLKNKFLLKHKISFLKTNKTYSNIEKEFPSFEGFDLETRKKLANKLEKEIRSFFNENKHLKGISQYKFVDENLEIFRISDVSSPNKKGNFYEILHPLTNKICKNPAGGYRYNKETLKHLLETNQIYFGESENTVPQFKRYLKNVENEVVKSIIENYDEGYNDLKSILSEADFNNPKPVSLVKYLLSMINKEEFFVLDFFAGSGTIIQAVEEVNQENNKNIYCLAITSNENNICEEITKKTF